MVVAHDGPRVLAPIALATVLILIVVLPSIYRPGPRPIYEGVQHLQVVRKQLQRPGSVLVAEGNYNALCNYLAYSYQRECNPIPWASLRSQLGPRTTLGQILDRAHAAAFYVEGGMLTEPAVAKLVAAPRAQGWRQVAQGNSLSGPWRVLVPLGSQS